MRQLHELFSKEAERYVVEMYSTPPLDSAELSRKLEDSLPSQESRQRILDAVSARIAAPPSAEGTP